MLALLTRETRWFRSGTLPGDVERWFVGEGLPITASERCDRYDLACAARGVGIKDRGGSSLDAKFRVTDDRATTVAPGVDGLVADWLKLTRPLEGHDLPDLSGIVTVKKRIITRRYRLGSSGSLDPVYEHEAAVAGCDVEIAEVEAAGIVAWTLCFEAFGPSHLLERSFTGGVAAFFADTPLPAGLALDGGDSLGYPAWISHACAERADCV